MLLSRSLQTVVVLAAGAAIGFLAAAGESRVAARSDARESIRIGTRSEWLNAYTRPHLSSWRVRPFGQ